MENHAHLQKILERMEENSRKQLIYSRIQCIFSVISAVCCVTLVATLLRFIPQLEDLAAQADLLMGDLQSVTAELKKLDLTNMIAGINDLVSTSQTGVEEAIEKISEIDISKLNKAVSDLAAVVQPLADFVKRITGGLR